jgi:hypothetical protein
MSIIPTYIPHQYTTIITRDLPQELENIYDYENLISFHITNNGTLKHNKFNIKTVPLQEPTYFILLHSHSVQY